MDPSIVPQVVAAAVIGLGAGLWLLARGFHGYRIATRIGDTGTSAIASMAAGDVRVAGTIEAAEVTLISPLQSRPCVYYDATVRDERAASDLGAASREVRAIGFRVRDPSGTVRIFPRGAQWDAPVRFDARSGPFGDEPSGLELRSGGSSRPAKPDRDAAIAALLAARPVSPGDLRTALQADGRGRRRYREARLEPGDRVTIMGRARPFSDLRDPTEADVARGDDLAPDDPEVAASIAEARAQGGLAADPAEAWGNAAIAGFGIGRPVREPALHPEATPVPLAASADAERYARTFHIAPEELVIATAFDTPLLIAHGIPGAAAGRHHDRFLIGLVGAVLAIASATALAVVLGGGPGR